ncbi:MAG: hypothetical protein ACREMY_33920 [bacterium]
MREGRGGDETVDRIAENVVKFGSADADLDREWQDGTFRVRTTP